MLRIISGSFDDLKAEMKNAQASVNSEIKTFKNLYKRTNTPALLTERLKQLDLKNRVFYAFSKVQPVKIDGITVDYRAVKAFEKKLKRTEYWVEKRENTLVIIYNEKGSLGRVELINLTSYYEGFKSIPEAVIV